MLDHHIFDCIIVMNMDLAPRAIEVKKTSDYHATSQITSYDFHKKKSHSEGSIYSACYEKGIDLVLRGIGAL